MPYNLSKKIFTLLFSFIFLLPSCDTNQALNAQKELLIYCGITMVKPIKELATIIEKKENIKVHISQGGSQDLYNSLKLSKVGDLYLPGSASYRKKNLAAGLLTDYQLVGYNQASYLVKKGNPKNISPDFNQLLRKDISLGLCNPESGSIGRETQKILDKQSFYNAVLANVILLNSDSRTLNNSLKTGKVDLIINWRATAFFKNNRQLIDIIDLPATIAKPKALQLNLLSFSQHPKLAKQFMALVASDKGQEVFRQHGFLDKNMKSITN